MGTTLNPRNPNISKMIRDRWNIIENTEELQKIFPTKPLISFRRLPNLRDMITSNKFSYPSIKTINEISSLPPVCTRLAKCTYCPKLHKISSFMSTHTKPKHGCKNLPPNHRLTCEICNVIYLKHCTKCNKQYIGDTYRPIRNRIYEHIASAKNPERDIIYPSIQTIFH